MDVDGPDIPDEETQFTEKHFLGLLMEGVYFCDLSANADFEDTEKRSFIKTSILSNVFAIECAANLLLALLPLSSNLKEQFDRMPTLEKYETFLFFRNKSVAFDRGCKEVQIVKELITYRNSRVHLKAQTSTGVKDTSKLRKYDDVEPKITQILKLPFSVSKLEYSHAVTVLQNVDAFFEKYFIHWCLFSPREVENILFDSLYSKELNAAFTLAEESYERFVPAKTAGMGLRFAYLPPPTIRK
jgi:hypothetical protein